MNKTDFPGFIQLLAGEVEVRSRPALSEAAILIWWDRLQGYSLAQVRDGFRRHALDAERGRFMPQPADIVAQVEGTQADRTAIAWGMVLQAMGSVGAYTDVVFDDPAIHIAVEDLGGWPKLCRTPMADLGFVRHAFCQSHRAAINSPTQQAHAPVLRGDRSADSEYLKVGLKPPEAVLIGSPERARLVMSSGQGRAAAMTGGARLAAAYLAGLRASNTTVATGDQPS